MPSPYVLLVPGYGTNIAWGRAWMSHLAPALVDRGILPPSPREGADYAIFDWGGPSRLLSSMLRFTAGAASDLASALPSRDEITLLGHSKGGNLILEYLCQVGEGRLPPHPGLGRAIVLNAPIHNWGARLAGAWLQRDRLIDLERRLGMRGAPTTVHLSHDPTDPVSCRLTVAGITCLEHTSGEPRDRFWIGSLQFWHPNHMACLRSGWPALLDALDLTRGDTPPGPFGLRTSATPQPDPPAPRSS